MLSRGSGILLHISSLPGKYGIGTFGREAYLFADFLKRANQKYWQILPLGPTSFGDSPYQSPSAFALNPYFIDLELLTEQGLLKPNDYTDIDFGADPKRVDYYSLYVNREKVLKKAFSRINPSHVKEYHSFTEQNRFWLEDYALYMSLKSYFDGKEWSCWEEGIKKRTPEAVLHYKEKFHEEIKYYQFIQYIAYKQWISLKSYINQQGIHVIGDIPIYVAADSADTWSNAASGIFKLDQDLNPVCVAGCPPDYFSAEGQYWGNTVYDWDRNRKTGYAWWIQRIKYALTIYDWVRIDHFRGFESYWEVPYGSPSAASGSWEKGPGIEFIQKIKKVFPKPNIIAEDLGYMTDDVRHFLKQSGFPGMKVLGFAFESTEDNGHLPHNYTQNCVVYTGTHDNDTTAGWMSKANKNQLRFAKEYLRLNSKESCHFGMVRGALSSVAVLAIIPMQDLLGLGSEARMNIPATLGGSNWQWRMEPGQIPEGLAERLAETTHLYGRG